MTIDPTATEALALELMRAIRAHLERSPSHGIINFEILNALAIATAPILTSAQLAGRGVEAWHFMQKALDRQIRELINAERAN